MIRILTLCAWLALVSLGSHVARGAESSEAAKAAYASAAALHNREAWELAAEEWAALLQAHPTDPLALKARYYLAICQLKRDDWPAAERTLREVTASKVDTETLALARLELARGLYRAARQKPDPQAFAAATTANARRVYRCGSAA